MNTLNPGHIGVAKLGGKAMASADNIRHSTRLVLQDPKIRVLVVSAAGEDEVNGIKIPKVTKELKIGARRVQDNGTPVERIEEFHRIASRFNAIELDLGNANSHSSDIFLSERRRRADQVKLYERPDSITALGEFIQGRIVTDFLVRNGVDAVYLDPANFLQVRKDRYGRAYVSPDDYPLIARALDAALAGSKILIISGYYGITSLDGNGEVLTFGNSGSNTTQSVVAAALDAEFTVTYSDVDGVRRAPPKIIPEAERIRKLNLITLGELACVTDGAIFQGEAVGPLMSAGIPLLIRSLDEDSEGTWALPGYKSEQLVEGIGHRKDMVVFKIFKPEMADVPGAIEQISRIFASSGLSIERLPSSDRFTVAVFVSGEDLGEDDSVQRKISIQRLIHKLKTGLRTNDVTHVCLENVSLVGGLYTEGSIGIGARALNAIAREGINALYPEGVENTFQFAVAKGQGERAVRALYDEFAALFVPPVVRSADDTSYDPDVYPGPV